MLSGAELRRWADRLGVPEAQIRRDHLVSTILDALPAVLPEATFFADDLEVRLRYADLPPGVRLNCPTLEGAAAMKLNAWADRGAARDLCDLYALAKARAITRRSLEIAAAAARPVQRRSFERARLPSHREWSAALANQMPDPPSPEESLKVVRQVVARLQGWTG